MTDADIDTLTPTGGLPVWRDDYLKKGRQYEGTEINELRRRWIAAFRSSVETSVENGHSWCFDSSEKQYGLTDLLAEFQLRGELPPSVGQAGIGVRPSKSTPVTVEFYLLPATL